MSWIWVKLFEWIGLLLLLSFERSLGLPVAFFIGLFFMTEEMSTEGKLWLSLGWGVIGGIIYMIPLWQFMSLLVAGMILYDGLARILSGEIRRIWGVAGLQTALLWWLTQLELTGILVLYHLGVAIGVTLLIFGIRFWKYRRGSLGFSKRYGLK